jgi:NitT/TauT family transport system substrate-binding protein
MLPSPTRSLAFLLVLTALAAGCTSQPAEPLRVGLNPWPGYDFLYLAQQKGFIAEEGGQVEIVGFTSVGDSRRAFERGQVDAFGGTTVELLRARANARNQPRAFAVTNWSEGADQILARPGIETMADLAGKRVAVEPASVDLLVLAVALDRSGLAPEAVERVTMAQAEMADAMAEGKVQAAVSYPPASVRIRNRSEARPVFDTAQTPRAVLDLFIGSETALRQRPEDFTALVHAFDRAVRYAEAHPAESRRIMARREGIQPEALRRALSRIRVMDLADQRDMWGPEGEVRSAVARTALALHRAGHIDEPGDTDALVTTSVVERASSP